MSDIPDVDRFMLVWQYVDGVDRLDFDDTGAASDMLGLADAITVLVDAGADSEVATERAALCLRAVRMAMPSARVEQPGVVRATAAAGKKAAKGLQMLEAALDTAELRSVLHKAYAYDRERAGGPSVYLQFAGRRQDDDAAALTEALAALRSALVTASAALDHTDTRGAPRRAKLNALGTIANHFFTATGVWPLISHDAYDDNRLTGKFHSFVQLVCRFAGRPDFFTEGDFKNVASEVRKAKKAASQKS